MIHRFTTDARRQGSVLGLFALTVFVLCGVAALVIDVGYARLTQRQMQRAADAAALEGMRGRDDPQATDTEEARRQAASDMVKMHFDTPADHPRVLLKTEGGTTLDADLPDFGTSIPASQLLSQSTDPLTYQTSGLSLNLANDKAGDLVSGNYDKDSGQNQDKTELQGPHLENKVYDRSDFKLPDPMDTSRPDAFLARLRRTNETFMANDTSSSGPPVPILFGRAMVRVHDKNQTGLNVRATGIAQARPAWSVGHANSTLALEGYTPFAVAEAYWKGWVIGTSITVSAANGQLTDTNPTAPLTDVGRILANDGMVVNSGKTLTLAAALAALTDTNADMKKVRDLLTDDAKAAYFAYAPVYDVVGSDNRIIGFGRIQITLPEDDPTLLTLKKLDGIVAPRNASSSLVFGLSITDADFKTVLQAHDAFKTSQNPVLAPVLVR